MVCVVAPWHSILILAAGNKMEGSDWIGGSALVLVCLWQAKTCSVYFMWYIGIVNTKVNNQTSTILVIKTSV